MGCWRIACLPVSLLPGFLLILLEFGKEEEGEGGRGKTFLHCGRQDTVKSCCLYRKPSLGNQNKTITRPLFFISRGSTSSVTINRPPCKTQAWLAFLSAGGSSPCVGQGAATLPRCTIPTRKKCIAQAGPVVSACCFSIPRGLFQMHSLSQEMKA